MNEQQIIQAIGLNYNSLIESDDSELDHLIRNINGSLIKMLAYCNEEDDAEAFVDMPHDLFIPNEGNHYQQDSKEYLFVNWRFWVYKYTKFMTVYIPKEPEAILGDVMRMADPVVLQMALRLARALENIGKQMKPQKDEDLDVEQLLEKFHRQFLKVQQ
mgnify:CR=1 FL=1